MRAIKFLMDKIAGILKFLLDRTVYILIDIIIFCLAFFLIHKGFSQSNTTRTNAIYLSIGTSLAAAGIVMILELWKELSRNKLLGRIKNIVFDCGLGHIYRKRDLYRYDTLMQDLNSSLDITGYSLNAFYESYADLLAEKVSSNASISVRMLLVNPDTEFSKNRGELEGKSYESMCDSISRLRKQFNGYPNVELRKINSPLSTMIFKIDRVMFIGPHFHRKPSKSTVTFELDRHGWLYEEYEREFERLWRDSVKL